MKNEPNDAPPTPSGNRIAVRPATLADADTIADFAGTMALETEEKRLDPAVLRAGVRAILSDERLGRYFVAEDVATGRVVGQTMITYEWSDWRDGLFWWIQSVYVVPDRRRTGVFRTLHARIREIARAEKACGLRLYVHRHNRSAMATYDRLGMLRTEYEMYEEDWSAGAP